MKKLFLSILVSITIFIGFLYFINQVEASPDLHGSIISSAVEVESGEEFTITVEGYSDEEEESLAVGIFFEREVNVANNNCESLIPPVRCRVTFSDSKNVEGIYIYSGLVMTVDGLDISTLDVGSVAIKVGEAEIDFFGSITGSEEAEVDESFAITIRGETTAPRVINRLYLEGIGLFGVYHECGGSEQTCERSWIITKSEAGSYEYSGSVRDVDSDGENPRTKTVGPIIVRVEGAPSSGGTSGTSGTGGSGRPGVIENPLGYENFEDLVNAIINFMWKIATPLAAIMFVISGIMFVTSVGSPERVKTARNVALYTAIGYGIIIIASGLIKVLQSLLQGS